MISEPTLRQDGVKERRVFGVAAASRLEVERVQIVQVREGEATAERQQQVEGGDDEIVGQQEGVEAPLGRDRRHQRRQ